MMNNNSTIPGWNYESDACVINQKSPIGLDQDLVELLWKNGQVVLSSQTQRKPVQKNDASSTLRNGVHFGNSSSNLSQQEDETASWIQYQVEDHPMGQELCSSNLLSQLTPCEVEAYKPIKQLEEPKFAKFATPNANLSPQQQNNMKPINPMPAPRFQVAPDSSNQKTNDFVGGSSSSQKVPKFSHHFSAPFNAQQKFREKVNGNNNVLQSEGRECSVMTVGSSHCGSNNIITQEQDTTFSEAVKDCVQRSVPNWSNNKGKSSEMIEATVTSSSGGSGSSLGKTTCSLSTGNHLGLKRKITDADESEEQSEATEPKSGVGNKTSQRSGSSRRNRAAEVHNLSERRRRDRINEKMRTLQQLIPNSNKTDKASMLEEAIEYLKSLQLQLQVMWMGAGMTPVMFPGIQHYMSQMSAMGMAAASQPSLPSMQNPMQIPRMPLDQSNMPSTVSVPHHQTPSSQALMCQNPVLGAFNYQNHQMQNPCLADQYARYMAYHHLMQTASQPMNVFGYGSQAVQQSQTMMPPSNSNGTMNVAPNFEDAITGKMGTSTFQQLNSN